MRWLPSFVESFSELMMGWRKLSSFKPWISQLSWWHVECSLEVPWHWALWDSLHTRHRSPPLIPLPHAIHTMYRHRKIRRWNRPANHHLRWRLLNNTCIIQDRTTNFESSWRYRWGHRNLWCRWAHEWSRLRRPRSKRKWNVC